MDSKFSCAAVPTPRDPDATDEAGFNVSARPLCPFCSKPWSDGMMDVYVSSGGGGCETCGYGGEGSATIDIVCDGCSRLIYRKEFWGY